MAFLACDGMICSLKAILMASATGWNMPPGPTRFGPRRPWIFATTRRSINVIYAKAVSRAKITMALLITAAVIGLLRKSRNMRHLLLLCPYPLWAQAFPRQAGIEWIRAGNLQQYFLRAGIVPLVTQVLRQRDQDFPIGFRARQRAQGMKDGLHVVIDIGHAAIFFGKSDRGQHHVGLLCRLRKQNILHNQEFQVWWELPHMPHGIGSHHI